MTAHSRRVIHLWTDEVSLVIVQRDGRLPSITHWGAPLVVSDVELSDAVGADSRGDVDSDERLEPSILPEHALGWSGLSGIRMHRGSSA
ncbi:MAG TPA: hypothetical protein VNJ54_03560 [Plantibacter sp.]|uniref:hypothetical protein n=1 Tax=Plantibacter sp. TaxID=1871045 RepID=UPI002C3AB927|nr:hypothetical protein [Plantibacter sp.]